MPTLTKSDDRIFPAKVPWAYVNMNAVCHVDASDLLAAFVAERLFAVIPAEAVQLEDGTYDLHPDVRFVPQDVPPGD